MSRILTIGVYAADDIRAERLKVRNPEMDLNEASARLDDLAENVIPNCHLYIDTTLGGDQPNIEAIELMKKISDANLEEGYKKNTYDFVAYYKQVIADAISYGDYD